ncbi:hypothetical protein QRO11_08705 [Paracidovorax citrulli]|uniref:hypothetical protein n=1 Tax=Paracidovorax citrulli TaxID=80869 RepID=UPI001F3E92B2|nr:hypothetical protein [Paracidovorax citrulli]WIY36390.1 hypothetical protein QRO11_08705 [Paracidovorax citrulli]
MNPPSAASAVDPQVPAPLPEALPSSGLPHEGMPAPASGPARMRQVAETGCAATRRWLRGDWTPEWFCAFLAGNRREQGRFRQELATMRGSVAWLLRQRRQGRWSAEERERLRGLMRSASSVSPYLLIWAVPGSMLLLPFMAWFIDWRRSVAEKGPAVAMPPGEEAATPIERD